MSALHTLTAQYTDSEGEEGNEHVDYSDPEEKQIKAQIIVPQPKKSKQSKKVKRLVSYNDNDIQEEEDFTDEEESSEEEEPEQNEQEENVEDNKDKYEKFEMKYGYSLPPEPTSKLNPELQDKITSLYKKINESGFDLNKYIQDKKTFRNPSIYEKLIQFCGINELSTNFPTEIYDASVFGPESFYEELAKAQKNEMDKLEKQKKENIKTEAVKRKSKWDQQAPTTVSTSVTTSANSTTKTIIISSTGQLKKPKI
jgi:glucan-binding YG repeat protein